MASMSGSMTWDLIANADKYVAGMNKAAAATRGMESRQKAMTRQTKMLQSAVALVSAAAIVRFGSQSVKAYRDAEKAQAKLAQSFAKFPKLADTTIGAMRSMNAELQKSTIYDDDVTAAMQARLAMYDLTGQQLRELTPLVMDYASATGQDLASAGDAIGKSLLGNTRALKAVGISYKATGDRARDYAAIQSMLSEKVGGFAESEGKTAAGQAAILANAYGELQESVGEALLPALQALMDVARPMLDTFNELPKPAKTAAVVIGAVGTAALVATPRVLMFRTAVMGAGEAGATGAVGMGKFAKGLTAVATAAAAVATVKWGADWLRERTGNAGADAERAAEALRGLYSVSGLTASGFDSLGVSTSNLDAMLEETFNRSAWTNFFNSLNIMDHLGIAQDEVDEFRTWAESVDAGLGVLFQSGGASARQAEAFFGSVRAALAAKGATADEIAAAFPVATEAMKQTASAAGGLTGAMGPAAASVGGLAGAAAGASVEVADLNDALDLLLGTQVGADEATANLEAAFDDAAKAAKENGETLDLSTEAGRANQAALAGVAKAALSGVDAWVQNGDSAEAVAAKTKTARAEFVAVARKMGLSKTEARALADEYGLIPGKVKTTIETSGLDEAVRQASVLASTLAGIGSSYRPGGSTYNSQVPRARASGGLIVGPGTGTSDSIPAMVSNGEYVVKASSVARYGVGMFHALNAERFASGGLVGGSSGGRRRKTWDRGVRDSVVSANGLFDAFDMDAYAEATERVKAATEGLADARKSLVSAEDDVAAARRAVNQAGSPEEQARAEQQLAEALRARASAEGDVAQAQMEQKQATASMRGTKLTSDNVVAKFRQRAQKLDKFRRDLQTLRKRGLSRAIIQELIDAGIEEGGAMAAALVAGNDIGKLNNIYGDITRDSRGIARTGVLTDAPGSSGGSGGSGGGGTTGSTGESVAVALSFEKADRPIVLKVEGEQVWKALLKLKKAKGGASLGLS